MILVYYMSLRIIIHYNVYSFFILSLLLCQHKDIPIFTDIANGVEEDGFIRYVITPWIIIWWEFTAGRGHIPFREIVHNEFLWLFGESNFVCWVLMIKKFNDEVELVSKFLFDDTQSLLRLTRHNYFQIFIEYKKKRWALKLNVWKWCF